MYDTTDPRSALATAGAPDPAGRIPAPQYHDFTRLPPDEVSAAGSRTWVVRGQNVVVVHVRPVAGDPLDDTDLTSEHVVLLPRADSAARFRHPMDGERTVRGPALVVVPPGPWEIVPLEDGDLVRLVDTLTPGWPDRARNAGSYRHPHPGVAPLVPWPEPVGGARLRSYHPEDAPSAPGRFGTIYRTRTFMVNFLPAREGPRDRATLSPHHHDDFEQLSLAVGGEFVHHVRTPWGKDADAWRDDDHVHVGSPSVAVIPPPTVHTTEAVGHGTNLLIDIFSPPRRDFSARPGWVLNADDYPAPAS